MQYDSSTEGKAAVKDGRAGGGRRGAGGEAGGGAGQDRTGNTKIAQYLRKLLQKLCRIVRNYAELSENLFFRPLDCGKMPCFV